uniref:Highly divergent homeobox n=1 Tax=Cyanoderma ruficeps TaxID=181631 RepID=A0A8C3QK88_9PASS
MNLRSVFTVEQQRILQRYYENGMTNQSKNCFQLILQCAQETKLDFSVVRTWVGNKRRKMSSKSAMESGGIPPGTAPATSSMPPEAAVRNVVNIARSQSQKSSWTSSNNDVIVTGIYSPASSLGRPGAAKHTNASMAEIHKTSIPRLPGKSNADFQQQHIPLGRQVPHCKNASLLVGEKTIILSRQTSVLNSANSIYSHTKKSYGGSSVQTAELVLPQKPMICHRPCKAKPLGCQCLQKPEHVALASHVPPGPRAHPRDPACGTQNLEIREVFSLAVTDQPQRLVAGSTMQKHPSLEGSCLSIAMETGDVDDEYTREEELASMGAQIQSYSRYCEGSGSAHGYNQSTAAARPGHSGGCGAQLGSARDVPDNLLYHSREFHLPARTSLHATSSTIYNSANSARSTFSPHFTSSSQLRLSQNQNNYQISGNLTVPWITGCSRKRAVSTFSFKYLMHQVNLVSSVHRQLQTNNTRYETAFVREKNLCPTSEFLLSISSLSLKRCQFCLLTKKSSLRWDGTARLSRDCSITPALSEATGEMSVMVTKLPSLWNWQCPGSGCYVGNEV